MSKVKKPKLEDYLKQSKGQGLGSLVNQGSSTVTNTDTTRVITSTNG
jgi:hypothetical protein